MHSSSWSQSFLYALITNPINYNLKLKQFLTPEFPLSNRPEQEVRRSQRERKKKEKMMSQKTEMKRVPWEDAGESKESTIFTCFQGEDRWFPPGWSEKALGNRRKERNKKDLSR